MRSENGGLPIASSNVSAMRALVKSSLRTQASGCSKAAIWAVHGSISTAVNAVLPTSGSGISAMNSPVPAPGSSTVPPPKPMRVTASQMARTMNSGV